MVLESQCWTLKCGQVLFIYFLIFGVGLLTICLQVDWLICITCQNMLFLNDWCWWLQHSCFCLVDDDWFTILSFLIGMCTIFNQWEGYTCFYKYELILMELFHGIAAKGICIFFLTLECGKCKHPKISFGHWTFTGI